MRKGVLQLLAWIAVIGVAQIARADDTSSATASDDSLARALDVLRRALTEQQRWQKVHTAEALLVLSHPDGVLDEFAQEQQRHGGEPEYRIGIWRVLAQADPNADQRAEHLRRIVDAALADNGPDRVHAIESLAKLNYQIPPEDRSRFAALGDGLDAEDRPYLDWLLTQSGDPHAGQKLLDALQGPDPIARDRAAYALLHLRARAPAGASAPLAQSADALSFKSDAVRLVAAAYVLAASPEEAAAWRDRLVEVLTSGTAEGKYEVVNALALRGNLDDLPLVEPLLASPDADLRIAAALALQRIERRRPLPFERLDWFVLAIYALAMLAVGVYYERRTKTTDDYLLGGRTMKPWAVGLSYFATLFSTITFLAFPGEMIKHGPMILSGVLAYPLIYFVSSRWLIPFIMRLRVTSAYEILEARFGLGIRMLGSLYFLLMRVFWMAVIIYATSRTVLVPLMRLDESQTYWVCTGLGLLTVVYTSLGGLRAVVWTDVAQTFILLFAIALSIGTISAALGGVDAWWPRTWQSSWEAPRLWDPTARVTALSAILSMFLWYVCTAGSDQMAIQRYLATRDAPSANRMFGISLACNALVTVLLAALGLALFAFFKANPAMLPDGHTLSTGADGLLPQYIVKGLPPGISGLIVAGLLAAAMSSLSSGLSSCCSVITVDWIDRFRTVKLADADHVRLARGVSWAVGIVVIALTYFAGMVPGSNLLEITNKFVNLLTAPLFVLFFMAMFVPWATTLGTWASAVASVAAAVSVAYFDFTGLSFLWIMPTSLATGIAVGCLVSLLPVDRRRPMIDLQT